MGRCVSSEAGPSFEVLPQVPHLLLFQVAPSILRSRHEQFSLWALLALAPTKPYSNSLPGFLRSLQNSKNFSVALLRPLWPQGGQFCKRSQACC